MIELTEPLFEARDLAIGYGRNSIATGLNLTISPGERWGIVGPNGAGKTTLLRTLMGILPPVRGTLRRRDRLRFGYVKQRDHLHDLYPFTVLETVRTGRYRGVRPFVGLRNGDRAAVEAALERTGIADLRDRPVRDLSGGQRQRVLIARALCSDPDVILLDEPTNDMDIAGEESVLALIRDVHAQTGAAVLIISHLIHAVLRVSDRILFVGESGFNVCSKDAFVNDSHLERCYGVPIHIHAHPDGTYAVAAGGEPAAEKDGAC